MANFDVAFATAFGTLVGGAFLVGYVKRLGGSDLWIGWLAAVPSLLGILQIPGAIWGRGFTSYKRFILPGGGVLASRLHVARAVCRRAERHLSILMESTSVGDQPLIFVNRLSDLLFTLARLANQLEGIADVEWNV